MTLRDEYLGLVVETRGFAQLPDDWDGEGATAPKLVSIATTLGLLNSLAKTFPNIPAPDLGPCANGSLDLYWKHPNFTLLMNVNDSNLSWYGEKGNFKTKGNAKDGFPDLEFIRELTASDAEEKHG